MSYRKFCFHYLANVELKPHTNVLKKFFHIMETSLCDDCITIIFQQQENLEALIQTRLKGCYNNAINVRISLKRYGSKIWKVSRCRPAVSNETILKTKQKFFFTKLAPVKSIADILLLGFQLILFSRMFISSFTNIYFFVKKILFKCLYFSEYKIRMFLFVFLVEKQFIHEVRTELGKWKLVIQNVCRCIQVEGVKNWL